MPTDKRRNRPAPAYQEYASDILANRSYRAMTLAERGLWDTIRKECWVNGSVPSSKTELAKYLGLPPDKINELFTPNLMKWFKELGSDLVCPELDAYRLVLEGRSQSMSIGGGNGGRKTQENRRNKTKATLEARVKPLSREETNGDEKKGRESSKENILSDEDRRWLQEYGDGKPPTTNDYLKQSKGH
jgi:hypothetical protein